MKSNFETILAQAGVKFEKGLQALENADKKRIEPKNPSLIDGSANIDECLKKSFPESNRWDYAIMYNGEAFFIEVHPPNEIKEVIKKLHWLKAWLDKNINLSNLKSPICPFTLITTKAIKKNPQTQKMIRDAQNRENLFIKENYWKHFPD